MTPAQQRRGIQLKREAPKVEMKQVEGSSQTNPNMKLSSAQQMQSDHPEWKEVLGRKKMSMVRRIQKKSRNPIIRNLPFSKLPPLC